MVYPLGSMDFIVVLGSRMPLKAHRSWSHGWFLLISNRVLVSYRVIFVVIMTSLRSRKFSCGALLPTIFASTPITSLFSEPYSHGLHLSVLCDFSLVAFGNGVTTNDWWCRDETESLLWCTYGWAARHALVSQLIVVIHYGTIPMCSLVWTSSQSDRCILSR